MSDPQPSDPSPLYDRPQQPWVCGRAVEGDPCALGPLRGGKCPASAECEPVRREGKWVCKRSETRGGPCLSGPQEDGSCGYRVACRPVPSLRLQRARWLGGLLLFGLGGLMLLLFGPWRHQFLCPAPLDVVHARALRDLPLEQRCAKCHAAAEQSFLWWMGRALGWRVGPTMLEKCLACHEHRIPAELALWPHNLPVEMLRQQTASLHGVNQADAEELEPTAVGCTSCHQEHRGGDGLMTRLANPRCQACHVRQFESFAQDHPDFGIWPYERRTGIAFSHATHSGKHFAAAHVEFDCKRCHVLDATQQVHLLTGYEASCAACHNRTIATGAMNGVTLFQVPSMDLEAFRHAGIDIGEWPERASGDFDGRFPPLMTLSLMQDEDARQAIQSLGGKVDLFYLEREDPIQLQAAATLARSIQQLLPRLEQVDRDLRERARELWWPQQPPLPQGDPLKSAFGGYALEEESLSLRYKPIGHADPMLRAWIDEVLALPDRDLRKVILEELTAPMTAPATCIQCHSIDQQPAGKLLIHWEGHNRLQEPHSLMRYSHRPHLLPSEEITCATCHAIDTTADPTANYQGHDPQVFVSDFLPMTKATCATCHNETAGGDHCGQCHRYHATPPVPLMDTLLPPKFSSAISD